VGPQTGNDGVLGLGDVGVDLVQLLAVGQLLAQLLDLLLDAVVAHLLLPLLLGERRLGGRRIGDLLDERGLAGLLGLAGQRLAELGEVGRLLVAQLLELGGQALLVLEFLLARARRVGLGA
jgi:hypothetical protein